jgi:two pore calcium channel protein
LTFVLEMTMKLLVLGWRDYTTSASNCFDGTVTVLTLGTSVYSSFASGDQQQFLVRYVLAIRVFRLGRLLGSIPRVRLVAATFFRMLPAAAKLLQILFVAMYCFSALGVQLFGGLINYGPQYATLQATSFGKANYYANNFNDLGSGMVVCFELLVVNNWFIIAAVYSMPVVRLLFVAVYVLGVLVCLNIVVAFALESFDAADTAEKAALADFDTAPRRGR